MNRATSMPASGLASGPVSGVPGQRGFTLLELIVVVSILGMLTALLLPGMARKDDAARRRDTDAAFEAIRQSILGPRGQTGPDGRPYIGGYVGDMGELPRLYATKWDPDEERWFVSYAKPAEGSGKDGFTLAKPYGIDTGDDFAVRTDAFAQPVGLWRQTMTGSDGLSHPLVFPGKWHGPYIARPRDPYPEDNPFAYGDGTGEEALLFVLRESEGRLHDGWGRSFIVLTDEELKDSGAPRSLVFVSAGPDGDFDPEGLLDEAPDAKGPNADNIVYRISAGEYEDTTYRIEETWARLEALRAAMLPARRTAQGAQAMPTGYAADVGGLETLFGSYVFHEGSVYVCTRSHTGSNGQKPGSSSHWQKVDFGSVDRADVPGVPQWSPDTRYSEPKPYLLKTNADHVEVDDVVYRCGANAGEYCNGDPSSSDDWQEEPTVAFPNLELSATIGGEEKVLSVDYGGYQSLSGYYAGEGSVPWWAVNTTAGQPPLGLGWRGGYIAARNGPPLWRDAWGQPLTVRLDQRRNIQLISMGPDGALNTNGTNSTSDDLGVTLFSHEYEVPLDVEVKDAGTIHPLSGGESQSYVEVWAAHNGYLHRWQAGANGTVPEEFFRFGRSESDGGGALLPMVQVVGSDAAIDERDSGGTAPAALGKPAERRVPVGRVYMEYRQKDAKNAVNGTGFYASPHPTKTLTNGTAGPTGCQGMHTMSPLGGSGYELCAD